MKKTILFSLLILALGCQTALAQEIRGKIVNEQGKSMRFVNCVLRNTADGSYIASAVTNAEGEFSLQSTARDCTLSLRMLGFVSKKMECEVGDLGTILLRRETKPSDEEEDGMNFPPVVMNRDTMTYHIDHKPMEGKKRPALFIKDSTLVYNIDQIPFKKTFANAKELVKALPSVVSPDGSSLKVVGAKVTTLIVTGSFENPDSLNDVLKSLPAEKVKRVIVEYGDGPTEDWPFAAGATLNVILKRR